ncbi:DegT/DnrJ/EryC1/StrS family aminotransferase [Candidatus Woesearchaeota archaeon]|nr:DegT/DnrJ/EryC1/StrS family aminotransferase [Candidatus Woesearchaeota archaeon]
MKVPYTNFKQQYESIGKEILSAITPILASGDFVMGDSVKKFEKDFADYSQCKYAIGVANGTDALFLSLKALGIGPGDEVITPPNSFLATAGAIIAAGAKPVFVDVREDYNIDPELIEKAITPKTRAILPVHLTGRPVDMEPIMNIAKKHKLFVVEDAAQAVGAEYKGKKVGSFGDAAGFSLHPLKNLNIAGDGGLITTSSDELYKKLSLLHNHGLKNRDECECWGFNSRLDSIHARIALVKLKHIDNWTGKIRKIAKTYAKELKGIKGISYVPVDKPYEKAVYHTFIIQCDKRDELQQYLLKKGIGTKIHYPIPIHLQKSAASLGYKPGDFPMTETQAKRILSLPIYPELTEEQIRLVIKEIKGFYKGK